MYAQKSKIPNLAPGHGYWSSTEFNNLEAYGMTLNPSTTNIQATVSVPNAEPLRVRAIRSF